MRATRVFGIGLVAVVLAGATPGADDPVTLPQEFTAMVQLEGPRISGTLQLDVVLRIERLTPPEVTRKVAELVGSGGQDAILDALRGHANGSISVGSKEHPLNLVTAKPTDGGVRYVAVSASTFGVFEKDSEQGSARYPFGVLAFEVDGKGVGSGTLFPAASISVADDGTIVVENYSTTLGKLVEVHRK